MLQLITAVQSWHVLVRIGIATAAVVAIAAFQLPAEIAMPGEPFLLNFVVVVMSSVLLGRTPGYFTVAETSVASVLFFESLQSFRTAYAVDLLALAVYTILAAASVEAFCRLVGTARSLAESEARFRATFENAAVGIAHLGPDLRWLRANDTLCRIVGWPIDELVTKSLQDITHPDDLEADLARARQMRHGEIDNYDLEKRYRRKDGAIIWGKLTVSCVRKSDGSLDYFVAVVENITARKNAEDQVRLLMREANHRAKNMLNLVQVIARQTAARDAGDFKDRFTERIQALASNQDLLVRHRWQGIDVEDLVRAQLAHFADLIGSRINVDGAKLRLNAAASQAIGLALHELATNAGKYGALSTDVGCIDIDWQSEGDVFTMNWRERDGPPVQPPKRRGFGSTVTESMAKHAVDGEVQLAFAPTGVEWRLTCPAANALDYAARKPEEPRECGEPPYPR